ncbi:hypothetical protein ISF6_4474 [Piscinibacter sakaiensis]|uniref:Peptidase S9 prolyl oligopeptidase catalytic domain-containing protein n=1 Tax=Piscinibacter sakaiensis TaxID=1547922 RepID=A0A0K8NVK0_PISS1|nr:hypothetical protein ISF6_4474 [Piscinibacter sakaiensis]
MNVAAWMDARAAAAPQPFPATGPSVREVVEFTRLARLGLIGLQVERKLAISPKRDQAFIVTRRALVDRERNVYELLLLDLRPQQLERRALGQAVSPVPLLTLEAAMDTNDAQPYLQDARWVSDDTIAFRARMDEAAYQVYTLGVRDRRLTQRTFEPTGVASFEIAANLGRVVYATWIPEPPLASGERSLVVGNRSFYSVNFGQANVGSQRRPLQYAVIDAGAVGPGRRLGEAVAPIGAPMWPSISVSPDGRWAVIPRFEAEHHLTWAARYPLMAEVAAMAGPALAMDPRSYFVRPQQWLARRSVAYRLDDGAARPLVDAPDDASPANPSRVDAFWPAGGDSVVVAGTHLPLAGATDSTASHVIEYWPDTGRRAVITALGGRVDSVRAAADGRSFTVRLERGPPRSFARGPGGRWQEVNEHAAPDGSDREGHPIAQGWRLGVEQGPDQPPDVVARGPHGEVARLTALHPQFSTARWGSVRPFSWQDERGVAYTGGLLLPPGHDASRRYPVVLQTYGFDPRNFYLDGSNLADGFSSGYAGRAFLAEDILVLALPHSLRMPGEAPEVAVRHDRAAAMVRSAIGALVSRGLADPERIGLMGWSIWGEHVLNLLTFHDLPVRAASLLDGDSNSLFAMTVVTGHSDYAYRRFEATNGGTPYGEGLARWVAKDPSLHTDCIRAAVRIENYGPSSKINWDIYGLLRRQYKPVEKVDIPGGAHALAHPLERMVSLQGNVDWYAFWLAGKERREPLLRTETSETLRAQYARWQEMAELKRLDAAKPRCAAVAGGRP